MKSRVIQDDPRSPEPPGGSPPGPGPRPARHLAARMGRWSAAHWKTATFGWLVIVAIVFYVGNQMGTETIDEATSGPGESGRVDKILDAGFTQPAAETVLVQSENGLTLADPAFRAAVVEAQASLEASPDVENIESPLDPAFADQVSEDGSSVLIDFEIRGDPDDAGDLVDPIVAGIAGVQDAHPDLYIGEIGDASAEKAVDGAVGDDLKKAGMLSLPITLIILLIALGALVAAGIPLLIGLTAVVGALGLTAVASQVMPVSEYASAVVLLVGLAVGVRLRHVLPSPLPRGAGGRPRRGRRARGRGGDVGPLGADLRPDGHGRDGRHVLHGRRDLRLVRPRDDPRRGRRGARLADRPAGAAVAPRRPRRRRPRPVHPAAARGPRGAVLGRGRSTACSGTRSSRSCSPAVS